MPLHEFGGEASLGAVVTHPKSASAPSWYSSCSMSGRSLTHASPGSAPPLSLVEARPAFGVSQRQRGELEAKDVTPV
jgi:hypothetical protein